MKRLRILSKRLMQINHRNSYCNGPHLPVFDLWKSTASPEQSLIFPTYLHSLCLSPQNWTSWAEIPCSECGGGVRVAGGTSGFVQHVLAAHPRSGEAAGPNDCPLCGKALVNQQALRYHLYRHAGLSPYRCTACSAAFRTPSTLKSHVQVQHSAASGAANSSSRHVCTVCGLCASTSGKLKIHQLTHTLERPYQCAVCAACFRQRSVLKVHEFTHSQQSKHACSRCGRCFATKSRLGKWTSHDIEVHI